MDKRLPYFILFISLICLGNGYIGEVYPNNFELVLALISSMLGSLGLGYLLGRSMK